MVTHHRGTFHDMPASDDAEHVNSLIELNSFILYSIGVKPRRFRFSDRCQSIVARRKFNGYHKYFLCIDISVALWIPMAISGMIPILT